MSLRKISAWLGKAFFVITKETSWVLAGVLLGADEYIILELGTQFCSGMELIPSPAHTPNLHSFQVKLLICKKLEKIKVIEPFFGWVLELAEGRSGCPGWETWMRGLWKRRGWREGGMCKKELPDGACSLWRLSSGRQLSLLSKKE